MSTIREMREKTGFTQQQLAEYLGISRSMLKMAEGSLRSLDDETAGKLTGLVNRLEHAKSQSSYGSRFDKVLAKDEAKNIKHAKSMVEDHTYRIMVLTRRLQKVRDAFTKNEAVMITGSILSRKSNAERFATWLETREEESLEKFKKNNPAVHEMMELDIVVLEAQCKVYEEFLKRMKK